MSDFAHQYGMLYEGGGGIGNIHNYLIGILVAAIICAIASKLMGEKGINATITKLICGLFLSFTVLRPLVSIDFVEWTHWTDFYDDEAAQAVAAGTEETKKALAEIIKHRTQAYILDKAQALNTVLEVEVTLSDDDIPVPVKVQLSGKASPYAKGRIQAILTEELGIEKENQIWT